MLISLLFPASSRKATPSFAIRGDIGTTSLWRLETTASAPPFIAHTPTRAVESDKSDESKSLKNSKSWKKSDKVGKVGFDFLSDFWQKKVPH